MSATAQAGPMLACDCSGHSYSASITRCAVFSAWSTSPFLTGVPSPVAFALRICSWSVSIAGKGAHSALHFTFSISAARTASHSRSATTAMKSFSRTTRAPGMLLIELSSTATGPQPAVGGRMHARVQHAFDFDVGHVLRAPHDFLGDDFLRKRLADHFVLRGSFGLAWTLMPSVLPYCLFHSSLWWKCWPPISSP